MKLWYVSTYVGGSEEDNSKYQSGYMAEVHGEY
jgi:hypothetical protein